MNIKLSTKISLIVLLILFGIIARFLPHAWNFTPMSAIAIFATTYLGLRYSYIILFVIMLSSDLFLGFYQWQIMIAVYASFAIAGILGIILKNNKTIKFIILCTLSSSLIFFIITNWAVWQFGTMYQHTVSGLFQSYLMAIPFFKNSLIGDIVFSLFLFGLYELFSLSFRLRLQSFKVLNFSKLKKHVTINS